MPVLRTRPANSRAKPYDRAAKSSHAYMDASQRAKPTQMRAHARHPEDEDDDYWTREFNCDTCDLRFVRRHDLKRHEKTHAGILSHFCQYCDRGFAQKNGLDVHERGHQKMRILQCPEWCPPTCPDLNEETCEQGHCKVKPFRDESSYRRHWIRFHGPDPPKYYCDQCPADATRKALLANHMRSQHDGALLPFRYRKRKVRGSSPYVVPPAIRVQVFDDDLPQRRIRSRPRPAVTHASYPEAPAAYSEASTPGTSGSDLEDSDSSIYLPAVPPLPTMFVETACGTSWLGRSNPTTLVYPSAVAPSSFPMYYHHAPTHDASLLQPSCHDIVPSFAPTDSEIFQYFYEALPSAPTAADPFGSINFDHVQHFAGGTGDSLNANDDAWDQYINIDPTLLASAELPDIIIDSAA